MATARAKTTRDRHTAKNSGAQPPAPVLAPTDHDSYDPDTATISSQESDPPPSPPPHDASLIAKTGADSRYRGGRSQKKINKLAMGVGRRRAGEY